MRNYTLIGHPLGHSMSPFIHERLFALSGAPGRYTLTDVDPEDTGRLREILLGLDGANVTIPYKQTVIPVMDELDGSAERYGAVNCVATVEGRLVGYNTDCDGFTLSVKEYGTLGGRVLLVGCGGVGRMIATEAARAGANLTIGIIPSDEAMVRGFVAELAAKYPDATVGYALTPDITGDFDLLVNASPVGMFPKVDACPVSQEQIAHARTVFDVIYNPEKTRLVQTAERLGIPAKGGSSMLVLQAARAHEIWYGHTFSDAEIAQVTEAMNRELERRG